MFYEARAKEGDVRGLLSLAPQEAKRLIAKAVARIPEVKRALSDGWVIIANGTTNAFVAEEILGIKIDRSNYTIGCIAAGEITANISPDRMRPFILKKGEPQDMYLEEGLREMGKGDVFIKGASAVDPYGKAGVLLAGDGGGTIGRALPFIISRDIELIVPVGLEKLIPSVEEASRRTGIFYFKYSFGIPSHLFVFPNPKVITEIQAFAILFGVKATLIGGGGIAGSEGSTIFSIEGDEEAVRRAFELVREIKGEPPLKSPPKIFKKSRELSMDALKILEEFRSRRW